MVFKESNIFGKAQNKIIFSFAYFVRLVFFFAIFSFEIFRGKLGNWRAADQN